MQKIKIFLASSNELEDERRRFEIEICRKTKMWFDDGIFLHLDIWEDLSARLSRTSSQDEYNKKVKDSDIFVLLAYTKVGIYTAEEFETAIGAFKQTDKPFVFTYFKQTNAQTDPSLQAFQDKLKALGHFYEYYRDIADLWNRFNKELDRLAQEDFLKNDWRKTNPGNSQVDNRGATIKNQFIGGNFHNPKFE
ncbi:conserved hypothetical protein [Chloroherpeton thalassium ATCC 35110]|uniref:DUF4062 domain-containing protein n=1 Tax=Chloroherpeton thalassium (strain ATCC 35110 / GB-78) TaxID=517418 RepID=B3QT80_CHLT3|nr:hypothetical protein [Chloroherpeton thalassium]ACF14179.1 conserved hypothetical protein [Chloroherpeton thalassium ATCC 35110]